jgi:hypothetical protein
MYKYISHPVISTARRDLLQPDYSTLQIEEKSAQTPDGKPGRELALRAEGFFRLDLLLHFGSSQK